jgi:hypothetical protein
LPHVFIEDASNMAVVGLYSLVCCGYGICGVIIRVRKPLRFMTLKRDCAALPKFDFGFTRQVGISVARLDLRLCIYGGRAEFSLSAATVA